MRRARLLASPAPTAGKPAAARPGTPQQKAGKDAAYQGRQASRQQDASKEQDAQTARTTQQQKAPDGSPAPER